MRYYLQGACVPTKSLSAEVPLLGQQEEGRTEVGLHKGLTPLLVLPLIYSHCSLQHLLLALVDKFNVLQFGMIDGYDELSILVGFLVLVAHRII